MSKIRISFFLILLCHCLLVYPQGKIKGLDVKYKQSLSAVKELFFNKKNIYPSNETKHSLEYSLLLDGNKTQLTYHFADSLFFQVDIKVFPQKGTTAVSVFNKEEDTLIDKYGTPLYKSIGGEGSNIRWVIIREDAAESALLSLSPDSTIEVSYKDVGSTTYDEALKQEKQLELYRKAREIEHDYTLPNYLEIDSLIVGDPFIWLRDATGHYLNGARWKEKPRCIDGIDNFYAISFGEAHTRHSKRKYLTFTKDFKWYTPEKSMAVDEQYTLLLDFEEYKNEIARLSSSDELNLRFRVFSEAYMSAPVEIFDYISVDEIPSLVLRCVLDRENNRAKFFFFVERPDETQAFKMLIDHTSLANEHGYFHPYVPWIAQYGDFANALYYEVELTEFVNFLENPIKKFVTE